MGTQKRKLLHFISQDFAESHKIWQFSVMVLVSLEEFPIFSPTRLRLGLDRNYHHFPRVSERSCRFFDERGSQQGQKKANVAEIAMSHILIGASWVCYKERRVVLWRFERMIEDAVLIWRLKSGSKDALRRIYEKYKGDLLKLAVLLGNDVNSAEDVVHDVFVNFAGSAAKIRPVGNLKGYLMSCVANRIHNVRRGSRRRRESNLDETAPAGSRQDSPEQWAILSEEMRLVSEAMGRIPYEQCEVITLHIHGGMTFREIAGIQETSINTIQGRYRYGMEKLRSVLNSEGTQ